MQRQARRDKIRERSQHKTATANMPVDYSKWDRLELSDDSDIEVHPNVDKRSFINAKRRQIHEQREVRKRQIKQLKTEREINSALLGRVERMLKALEAQVGREELVSGGDGAAEGVLLRTMVEVSAQEKNDEEEAVPEGGLTYGKMVASLIDQVKKEVDEKKVTGAEARFNAFIEAIKAHQRKIIDLNNQAGTKLAELEKEEASKITSESIHEGFSSGYVNKSSSSSSSKPSTGGKQTTVELLNPGAKAAPAQSSYTPPTDPDDVEITPLALKFVQIPENSHSELMTFIRLNPEIVREHQTDGLLMEAFNAAMAGNHTRAHACVHHGLLLQYCRQLGPDGIELFFKRITTKGHQAQKVFKDDVESTFARIKTRAKEIAHKKEEEVETIQLHAVEPGTQITISIPPADSEDPEEKKNRAIFEGFSKDLQDALTTGSLESVNKVLARMSVPEAEKVVEQLSEGGMLSLESEIIDATTEEGKEQIKRLEEEAKKKKEEDAKEVERLESMKEEDFEDDDVVKK